VYGTSLTTYAQQYIPTIKYRNLDIDLKQQQIKNSTTPAAVPFFIYTSTTDYISSI
jgi:hypothetical protein